MATQIKELEVNGVTYVEKGSQKSEPKNSTIKIVVLQRGWALIGRWSQEGDMCNLENAHVIRLWGTTKGLGELALEGKTSKTTLDKAGSVDFHILTTVLIINADEKLWDKELV